MLSPIANLLVAPLIPIAMFLGMVGVVASALAFPAGLVVSYVTWFCLSAILLIAKLFASVPHAVLAWQPSLATLALY